MDSNTLYKNHRDVDRKHSDDSGFTYEDEIIMNALNSKIEERTKKLENIKTEVQNESFELYEGIPKYSQFNLFPNKRHYFSKTQSWIGIVLNVKGDEFTARLNDKINSDTYEIATFDIEEVSPSDRGLLSKGAVFYWSVGFAYHNGQVTKESLLRFKRSVDFTEQELNEITDEAKSYDQEIKWE